MRRFSVENDLLKLLARLEHRDPVVFRAAMRKIEEVVEAPDIDHYKNLRAPLQEYKRAHIKGPFVLLFRHDPATDSVTFVLLEHHDRVYLPRRNS
jgi:mRNA-degrading endonuclease RelE of RelBE toxin-antitoxin system